MKSFKNVKSKKFNFDKFGESDIKKPTGLDKSMFSDVKPKTKNYKKTFSKKFDNLNSKELF